MTVGRSSWRLSSWRPSLSATAADAKRQAVAASNAPANRFNTFEPPVMVTVARSTARLGRHPLPPPEAPNASKLWRSVLAAVAPMPLRATLVAFALELEQEA